MSRAARSRQARAGSLSLNLDPLGDMVANSIGILLIVLIYTVLAGSATYVVKRLPWQRETDREERVFLVFPQGVLYMPIEELFNEFLKGLPGWHNGEFSPGFSELPAVADKASQTRIERDGFVVYASWTCEETVDFPDIWTTVTNRELQTETHLEPISIDQVVGMEQLVSKLPEFRADEHWINFIVAEGAVKTYQEARALVDEAGFSCGWRPGPTDGHLTMGPGGLTDRPQE